MKCAADLNSLKDKLSLIPLEHLTYQTPVSIERINNLQSLLVCYRVIISKFHESDKVRWTSFFDIGLEELEDHMQILIASSNSKSQLRSYNDCHNYLAASIQDAIETEQDRSTFFD